VLSVKLISAPNNIVHNGLRLWMLEDPKLACNEMQSVMLALWIQGGRRGEHLPQQYLNHMKLVAAIFQSSRGNILNIYCIEKVAIINRKDEEKEQKLVMENVDTGNGKVCYRKPFN
jgi:hypothetical protein